MSGRNGKGNRRVLFVSHYPVFGGPHNQTLRLKTTLEEHGWESIALLPTEHGNAADRLRAGGVEVIQIALHRLRKRLDPRLHAAMLMNLRGEVASIRKVIRDRQINVLVTGSRLEPHEALAARAEGIPVVWQMFDCQIPPLFRHLAMRLVKGFADSVMWTGDMMKDFYPGARSIEIPSLVFYMPVDTTSCRISPELRVETRRQLGIASDAPVVGMVGNINPQKGVEYFVQAAGIVGKEMPDARFLVVGARYETHRDYTERIEREVARTGFADRFIFTGARSDVEKFYPAMDVKLITSVPLSEGTPTTALEAMACGIPVVATAVGATPEVVEDGITGIVVPPCDHAAIARATLRLLNDPVLRQRMGHQGRKRAEERYDLRICGDVHVRAFEAALEHHRLRNGIAPAKSA